MSNFRIIEFPDYTQIIDVSRLHEPKAGFVRDPANTGPVTAAEIAELRAEFGDWFSIAVRWRNPGSVSTATLLDNPLDLGEVRAGILYRPDADGFCTVAA